MPFLQSRKMGKGDNMGSLTFTDCKFIYSRQGEERILLDLKDLLFGNGEMPWQCLTECGNLAAAEALLGLIGKIKQEKEETALPVIAIDVLLTAYLLRASGPCRILEYGCGDGGLSSHLAELLGCFHEESSLVCAYHTLDGASMAWMEQMAGIERLPRLSYLAGDYGCLQLRERYFDIVIVNGAVNYEEPYEVLADASELAAEDGIILCHADDSPLLESIFKLFFEEREEYDFSPYQKILTAKAADRIRR